MAEVLGIVGSVVGIAQLAGSIIITGTKLNGILKEMQEIPHEISTRLDQLHMLSLTLQQSGEADTIADVGPQFLLMGNAKQQCQTCLSGLTGLLEDITDRLQKSRGARRKLALARHMFRKDELARIEKQLSYSVDLLSVANQMYMIQLTPWDELQDGWNLFTEALKEGQWHICSYLLDHGVETYVDWQGYWPAYPHHGRRKYYIEDFVHPVKFDRGIEDQQLRSYQVLIRKVDHNDFLATSLLGCLQETPALFTSMRRSRWLDDEFYSPEFLEQRMRLCVHLVMKCADLRTKSADVLGMIPFCLEQHGNLAQALMDLSVSDNNGATLLHGLAAKFGVAGNFDLPQGQEIAERWTPLALEVIKRFPSLDCLCQTSARSRGPHLETPLLRLIQQSFDPRHPLCCQGPYRGSVCKRIKRCENSILSWLECLHVAGVNLREYGREEQRQHHVNSLLVRREFGLEYDCHSPGAHNWWGDVQLISFDFGESPSQWKFWWSEMTDEFAGQFWDMAAEQEISSLRIPGAWFEDDYPTSP
ncbi:hypothetical protein Daus18300_004842 [Diaporthe australafricana]|uniref:Fungal N-terminal domain-containing protein n=1 Tax=Diaporthe australafricana TaxID=127596 RepID=A0ABR3X5A8_9PEZI